MTTNTPQSLIFSFLLIFITRLLLTVEKTNWKAQRVCSAERLNPIGSLLLHVFLMVDTPTIKIKLAEVGVNKVRTLCHCTQVTEYLCFDYLCFICNWTTRFSLLCSKVLLKWRYLNVGKEQLNFGYFYSKCHHRSSLLLITVSLWDHIESTTSLRVIKLL